MARFTYDFETAEQRITAYIDFLLKAYNTDVQGLANMAGIPFDTLKAFTKAPLDENASFSTLCDLAKTNKH